MFTGGCYFKKGDVGGSKTRRRWSLNCYFFYSFAK